MSRLKFLGLLCVLDNAALGQQLVTNGQFNTGDLAGWTLERAVDSSYQFVGNGANDGDPGNAQYAAGSAKHLWNMGALGGEDDVIYQTISTVPGGQYTFVLNAYGGGHMDVWWNTSTFVTFGGNVANMSPPSFWRKFSFTEIATGSSTVIAVGGFNDGDFTSVSDIGVEAVPEPAAIAFLTLGTVALVPLRRRS